MVVSGRWGGSAVWGAGECFKRGAVWKSGAPEVFDLRWPRGRTVVPCQKPEPRVWDPVRSGGVDPHSTAYVNLVALDSPQSTPPCVHPDRHALIEDKLVPTLNITDGREAGRRPVSI